MISLKVPQETAENTLKNASQPRVKKTFLKPKITLKGIKKKEDDDSNVPIEEHIILRMPVNHDVTAQLREAVKKREGLEKFKIEFEEGRKARFRFADNEMEALLVDLPCIIESQKTLDNKQFYKIADISQMLVVKDKDEVLPINTKSDVYPWPHGLSAPLKYVRSRRFRKRISKKAIENVEREVERLLRADADADDVQFEVYDQEDYEQNYLQTEEVDEHEDEESKRQDEDDELDRELAAQIDEAFEDEDMDDEEVQEEEENLDSSDDEEDEEEEEEEGADETNEEQDVKKKMKLLNEEIQELEIKIEEKKGQLEKQANIIMKSRFENIIETLKSETLIKRKQLDLLKSSLIVEK